MSTLENLIFNSMLKKVATVGGTTTKLEKSEINPITGFRSKYKFAPVQDDINRLYSGSGVAAPSVAEYAAKTQKPQERAVAAVPSPTPPSTPPSVAPAKPVTVPPVVAPAQESPNVFRDDLSGPERAQFVTHRDQPLAFPGSFSSGTTSITSIPPTIDYKSNGPAVEPPTVSKPQAGSAYQIPPQEPASNPPATIPPQAKAVPTNAPERKRVVNDNLESNLNAFRGLNETLNTYSPPISGWEYANPNLRGAVTRLKDLTSSYDMGEAAPWLSDANKMLKRHQTLSEMGVPVPPVPQGNFNAEDFASWAQQVAAADRRLDTDPSLIQRSPSSWYGGTVPRVAPTGRSQYMARRMGHPGRR